MMQHEMTLWGAHRTIDCAKRFADDEFALLELLLAKAGNYIQDEDVLFAAELDFVSLFEKSERFLLALERRRGQIAPSGRRRRRLPICTASSKSSRLS